MGKLGTFLRLTNAEKGAAAEALARLAWAQLLVVGVPPKRWREPLLAAEAGGAPGDAATLRLVRQAVSRAARNIPTAPNCLPQALAARQMLRRRGIASELYIGRETGKADRHAFHAWLKAGEVWITGDCDESRYALLTRGPEHAPQSPLR